MRTLLSAIFISASLLGYRWIAPELEMHAALQDNPRINPEHPSIVMLGDSHTQHIDWKMVTHCPSVANYGITGNTSTEILARLPDAISSHPQFVFVMAGTNDPFKGVPVVQTIANIETMKSELMASHILFAVIAPPPLPRYQAAIDQSSTAATLYINFTTNDLAADHMHLRRSGYFKWLAAIAPMLKKYC